MHAINRAKEEHCMPSLVICEDTVPTRKRRLYEKYSDAFKDYGFVDRDGKPIRYKGNRPAKDDIDYNPIEICKEFMSCIPHTRIWYEGEEADDVLASYIYDNELKRIFMYSTDRDMWQLIDRFPNLKIFFDHEGGAPGTEYLMKKFDTDDFNKVALHKIIRGDSGDNVKSVRNYQFKRSIEAWNACGSTIESYLYQVVKIYGKDSKFIKQLLLPHNIRLMKLNRKLVQLRLDIDYEREIIRKPDVEKWKHLCHCFETPSLLRARLMEIF